MVDKELPEEDPDDRETSSARVRLLCDNLAGTCCQAMLAAGDWHQSSIGNLIALSGNINLCPSERHTGCPYRLEALALAFY